MKIVFMGTPDFAVPSLKALLKAGLNVVAVVTQPDRPSGRGKKIRQTPVKEAALGKGIKVLQPLKVRETVFIQELRDLNPDLIVVAAFGQILPEEIIKMPQYGCINVHASLLPLYRGAAPIHRAIINGEKETGVTIMQMDTGLDTGDMLLQGILPIGPDDTVGIIHDRLSEMGGTLLVNTIELIRAGSVKATAQDDDRATYASMLTRQDEIINWAEDAITIKNKVRGLNPWPGARTSIKGKVLKLWKVSLVDGYPDKGVPGQVLEASQGRGIIVQTGNAVLSLNELQLQGKKSMPAAEFLRGYPLMSGFIMGADYPGGGNAE